MSYSIIYGRQFVKTTKGIIPMILSGSNNCTEFIQGREVLERNWYPMTLSNKDKRIAIPAEELLERARAISTGDGADYEFAKQGGKWLYCKDVLKWVESGIRNAMNIERINFFRPNTPLYGRIVVWRGDKRETVHNCYCKTTQELEAFAEEMESAWKVYGSDKTVTEFYPYLSFEGREPLSIEKMASLSDDEPVVVKVAPYGYYTKTEHSCRNYERNRAAAKVFENIDDAIAELGSITLHASKVTFERAGADGAKSSKPAEKLFALHIKEGDRAGAYIVKLTRSRIWISTSSKQAKMFPSEKAAMKWAKDYRLTERFGNAVRTVESVKLEVKSNGC